MKLPGKLTKALGSGAAAALISLTLGFLNSVKPDKILVRALFFAVAAAAFVLLAGYLMDNFLSFSDEESEEDGDDAEEQPGRRVNILSPGMGNEAGDNEAPEPLEAAHTGQGEGAAPPVGENIDDDDLPSLDVLEESGDGGNSTELKDSADALESSPQPVVDSMAGSPLVSDFGENNDPVEIAKAVKTVLARDKE